MHKLNMFGHFVFHSLDASAPAVAIADQASAVPTSYQRECKESTIPRRTEQSAATRKEFHIWFLRPSSVIWPDDWDVVRVSVSVRQTSNRT